MSGVWNYCQKLTKNEARCNQCQTTLKCKDAGTTGINVICSAGMELTVVKKGKLRKETKKGVQTIRKFILLFNHS